MIANTSYRIGSPINPAGEEYHKIQTVFLRDPETNYKHLLEDEFARPEFQYLASLMWDVEEKVDGTNTRIHYSVDQGLSFGGKTDKADMPPHLEEALASLVTVDSIQSIFGLEDGSVTLYGEGYGAKIQSGDHYIRDHCSFILFDVVVKDDLGRRWQLERDNVRDVASKLGIKAVPSLGSMTLTDAVELVRQGFTSHLSQDNRPAEGIIARPVVELCDRMGRRIITKLKHKDFPRLKLHREDS